MTTLNNHRMVKDIISMLSKACKWQDQVLKSGAYHVNDVYVGDSEMPPAIREIQYAGDIRELTKVSGPTFVSIPISELFEYITCLPKSPNITLVFTASPEVFKFKQQEFRQETVIYMDELYIYLDNIRKKNTRIAIIATGLIIIGCIILLIMSPRKN
jgi:hypothetical protein